MFVVVRGRRRVVLRPVQLKGLRPFMLPVFFYAGQVNAAVDFGRLHQRQQVSRLIAQATCKDGLPAVPCCQRVT